LFFFSSHEKTKPFIWAGDMNVGHKEVDVSDPEFYATSKKMGDPLSCVGQPGFTDGERRSFDGLLHRLDAVDSFRVCNKNLQQVKFFFYSFFNPSS
jgi:exonuclease III